MNSSESLWHPVLFFKSKHISVNIKLNTMAELDEILNKYTNPVTGSLHGATFIAVDSKGFFFLAFSMLRYNPC